MILKKKNFWEFIGNIFKNNNLCEKNKNIIIEKKINNKCKIDEKYILDLNSKDLGNEVIQNLIIKYKDIIVLDLFFNEISDIKVLESVKFDKLEILNLGQNNISNIDILENEIFKELKELNLHYNNISDIKVLEKVKFDKLEILNLGLNKISNNINILENTNFRE